MKYLAEKVIGQRELFKNHSMFNAKKKKQKKNQTRNQRNI